MMKIINDQEHYQLLHNDVSELTEDLELCLNKLNNIQEIVAANKLEFATAVLESGSNDVETDLFEAFKTDLEEFVELIGANVETFTETDQEMKTKLGGNNVL